MRATSAAYEQLQEADKLTLGQPITIYAPYQVLTLLEQKGGLWLTVGMRGKYQAILLDNPKIVI